MLKNGCSKNLTKGVLVAALAVFSLVVFSLILVPKSPAQARGVPASVTSIGFGGNFNTPPGVPASVTSIGPNGLNGRGTALFPQPSFNRMGSGNQFAFPHHPHHQGFFPGGIPVVAVPYAVPYEYPVEVPVAVSNDSEAEDYNGGPTIFDRRGPGPSNRQDEERYSTRNDKAVDETPAVRPSSSQEPTTAQPDTHIVFKDGHSVDVSNYAIIGSTLYDLTPGHPRKIALSDIDLPATEKQNDDRGVDFHVPAT